MQKSKYDRKENVNLTSSGYEMVHQNICACWE